MFCNLFLLLLTNPKCNRPKFLKSLFYYDIIPCRLVYDYRRFKKSGASIFRVNKPEAKTLASSETTVTIYQSIRRNIAEK
jgi:hypothetical protein